MLVAKVWLFSFSTFYYWNLLASLSVSELLEVGAVAVVVLIGNPSTVDVVLKFFVFAVLEWNSRVGEQTRKNKRRLHVSVCIYVNSFNWIELNLYNCAAFSLAILDSFFSLFFSFYFSLLLPFLPLLLELLWFALFVYVRARVCAWATTPGNVRKKTKRKREEHYQLHKTAY